MILRRAVRFAIAPASGLTVKAISRSTPTVQPQVIDVSLGGMSIEFGEGQDPDLAMGAGLDVELSLGRTMVVMRAEVRRRAGFVLWAGLSRPGQRRAG